MLFLSKSIPKFIFKTDKKIDKIKEDCVPGNFFSLNRQIMYLNLPDDFKFQRRNGRFRYIHIKELPSSGLYSHSYIVQVTIIPISYKCISSFKMIMIMF